MRSPTGQIRSPCSEEKLPTTAAAMAPAKTHPVDAGRSRRNSASANASVTRYQAIWNPHNVFWYWTNENSNNVTGV